MASELLLDTRDLDPPEPLMRAISAARSLESGQYLRMIHRREPCLLFPALDEQGFAWHSRCLPDGEWEILVWRDGDRAAQAAAGRLLPRGRED